MQEGALQVPGSQLGHQAFLVNFSALSLIHFSFTFRLNGLVVLSFLAKHRESLPLGLESFADWTVSQQKKVDFAQFVRATGRLAPYRSGC